MTDPVLHLDAIDAVVVDLDGVVTDTARVHAEAWAEMFNAFLAVTAPADPPFDLDGDYLRFIDGKPRTDGVAAFLASRHLEVAMGQPDDPPTAVTVHGLGKRKDELFRARLRRDGVRTFPGTIDLLARARAAGKPIAVVSASRNCRDVLAAAGLGDFFDVVVDGNVAADQHLPGKPDPATFLEAARRLTVAPARMLLVEDALAGVEAGRRGGFGLVVGVDRHHHADDLRAAGADLVVGDLAELAIADDAPAGWTLTRDVPAGAALGRSRDALFALADGAVGVRGDLERGRRNGGCLTLVSGAYGLGPADDDIVRLLPGPSLTPLRAADEAVDASPVRHVLDMMAGSITTRPLTPSSRFTTTQFASLVRPGLVVQYAEAGPGQRWSTNMLGPPRLDGDTGMAARFEYREQRLSGGRQFAETRSDRARVVALAQQHHVDHGDRSRLERVTIVRSSADGRHAAEAALADAWAVGVDALAEEHRRAWAARWDACDVEIDGDPAAQEAIRFALFHLVSCAPATGEAGIGARGLTGLSYAGHVFWDADVFVLPALAATFPAGARAMLEYRVHRLDAARANARARGLVGARFPWESADTGEEVTPGSVRDFEGNVVAILTGEHEEHITSDVAWAALRYVEWSGDDGFMAGPGRDLVVDTARYWASRIRLDDDNRAHIDGVMGPDEYHEVVDDNAFTNVLVRWHLRHAATLVDGTAPDQAARWRALADALVDGYDAATGCHEQSVGYLDLEPLRVVDVAEVPVAADVLLGRARVAESQVVKQPDVLMAHHMVPDELPPGSLAADLDFYLPRTAHGSSLSPAVCATLLARAGRPDDALELFDVASRIDLDDLTAMTGGGLHLASLGGLWQAVVTGFAGVRVAGDVLRVDPALPGRWKRLCVRVRFHGVGVRLDLTHDRVTVDTDRPVPLVVHGVALRAAGTVTRHGDHWRQQ
ncbi:MAG TPA: HAD-IA family hydrolase [Acidimicrobiales bacterium]|nr:HAD-IA family hydrolase [Acidimicrobiales bacterium]